MVGLCLLQERTHPARKIAALIAGELVVGMKTAHSAPERAESFGVDEVSARLRTLAHGSSSRRVIVAASCSGPALKNSETVRRKVP
jgi:hypothetical protein